MREIKSRAWDNITKKMREVESLHFNREGLLSRIELFSKKHPLLYFGYEPSEFILMLYIGVTDKHGKEIYEGDIVRYSAWDNETVIGTIVYDETIAAFAIASNYGTFFLFGECINLDLEVIGNIYETPELLEVEDGR